MLKEVEKATRADDILHKLKKNGEAPERGI